MIGPATNIIVIGNNPFDRIAKCDEDDRLPTFCIAAQAFVEIEMAAREFDISLCKRRSQMGVKAGAARAGNVQMNDSEMHEGGDASGKTVVSPINHRRFGRTLSRFIAVGNGLADPVAKAG